MIRLSLAALMALSSNASAMTLEELCAVDKLCKKLKDDRGRVIGISPAFRKLMEDYRDVFVDTAERYGVDPRAPIGAVAAENTMNVQMSDDVQNWLAHRGITVDPRTGKEFTFGLGQINMPAALEAEAHMAKVDGRPLRSSAEVRKALLTLEGAAYYATGIVRQAQDAYKEKGIDISDRPDILATLYNLGNPAPRAASAATTGKEPQPNYFGFFVGHNVSDIEKLIGWDPKKKKRTRPRVSEELMALEHSFVARRALPLVAAPSQCKLDGRAEAGRFNTLMSRKEFAKVEPVAGPFRVVGRGVNCEMADYLQLEFLNGQRGWIPSSMLHDPDSGILRTQTPLKLVCSEADARKCLDTLKSALGDEIQNRDSLAFDKDNVLNVAISTKDGKPLKTSFKKPPVNECLERMFVGYQATVPKGTTAEALDRLQDKLKEFKDYVKKEMELDSWDDDDNPVRDILAPDLHNCRSHLQHCDLQIRDSRNDRLVSLEEFLRFKPAEKGLRSTIAFLQGRSIGTHVNPPAADAPEDDSKAKARAEAFAKYREKCKGVLEDAEMVVRLKSLEETAEEMESLQRKFQVQFGMIAMHGDVAQHMVQMSDQCESVDKFLRGEDIGSAKLEMMIEGNVTTLSARQAKRLQADKESLYGALELGLKNAETSNAQNLHQFRQMGGSAESCHYDLFRTLELVEKVSQQQCVDQVIVPDKHVLIGMRGAHAKKVVYSETDEKHFQVRLNGCRDGARSTREYIRGIK